MHKNNYSPHLYWVMEMITLIKVHRKKKDEPFTSKVETLYIVSAQTQTAGDVILRFTNATPTAYIDWSPDGKYIAFQEGENFQYILRALSNNPESYVYTVEKISNPNCTQACPSYSPDGTRIAFLHKETGENQYTLYSSFSKLDETILMIDHTVFFHFIYPLYVEPNIEIALIKPRWSPDESLVFLCRKLGILKTIAFSK